MKSKKIIWSHILGVILIIAYEQTVILLFHGRLVYHELLYYLVQVPFFYLFAVNFFSSQFRSKGTIKAIFIGIILIIGFFLSQSIISAIIKYLTIGKFDIPVTLPFYKRTFGRLLYIIVASFAYCLALLGIRKARFSRQQELRIMEQSRNQAEIENAFLRNQINPHLLFNSLQFIEHQVKKGSPKALQAVHLLGEVMLYSLKATAENTTVSLQEELAYVRQYIELAQLRNDDQLHFKLTVDGVAAVSNLQLPSGIIVNFIENIFKHGDLTEEDDPGTARIAVNGNQLTMQTRNLKRQHIVYRKTGIGMQNIHKRLDLLYPERYMLRTTEENNHYNLYFELIL